MKARSIHFILIVAFVTTLLHTYAHTPYDHNHDSTCNVYVLEELYTSSDVSVAFELPLLFVAFIYATLLTCKRGRIHIGRFSVRAPPLS